MARIRYLKPEFFFDDDLAALNYESRLFFQGLWCYADKAGRLEDKPKVLKAQIMPYDKVDVEDILMLLNNKFITRYNVDGKEYIQINNFLKHQKPHHTERESVIPPLDNGSITVNSPSLNTLKEKEEDKLKNKRSVVKKKQHLDFVYLSEEELSKLIKASTAEQTTKDIEGLNNYIGSTGKRYKSHYHTILNWRTREIKDKPKPEQPYNKPARDAEYYKKATDLQKQGKTVGLKETADKIMTDLKNNQKTTT